MKELTQLLSTHAQIVEITPFGGCSPLAEDDRADSPEADGVPWFPKKISDLDHHGSRRLHQMHQVHALLLQLHLLGIHILIAVGAVMMVVGFLGCYGAIQESQCLLGTFFTCLVILFACEVAAGILGYMHRETISKEMIIFYDSLYDEAMKTSLTESDRKVAAMQGLKIFHETLKCCGKGLGTSLFSKFVGMKDGMDVCSTEYVAVSCHTSINDLFSTKIHIVGIAALVIAIIMIFEMIFSMVLCCGIRNSPVY
uniref:Tryptophan hydroxylase 1b n=1 Tax=Oryzias latipes TaxID=8090 RepID=A0A3P9L2R8_ORYLA